MAKEPGKSIPKLFDSWYEVKAAYSFFARLMEMPNSFNALAIGALGRQERMKIRHRDRPRDSERHDPMQRGSLGVNGTVV